MYITRKDKEDILYRVINDNLPIPRVIEELFKQSAEKSKQGKYKCPLHNDKTPSLSADKFDILYKCFACPSKGRPSNLILDGAAKNLLIGLSISTSMMSRGEVLLAVAKHFRLPITFSNLNDEVDNVELEETVTEIMKRHAVPKVEPAAENLSTRFAKIHKRLKRGTYTIEEVMDMFASMQHEATDDPQNLDELYTNLAIVASGMTLEDWMED